MSAPTIACAAWLSEPALQTILRLLSADGEEARIAGGAVRNALLGQSVADVDIATTNLPHRTVELAQAAGFKAVGTGIEHGTVTVVADGRPFEVTTLRADIATDGRHATVAFGRDWRADAERRDFTINGLYAAADGSVIDLVGGIADLESRTIRFIGDAEQRIREDYLRILRFFRFFAWYGYGRPDAEGLKACARLKVGLDSLSAERVWTELRKLLGAPDPSRALLWMRQASVLTQILPESEKWGIDAIHGLVSAERDLNWPADPMLRLEAIIPPDHDRVQGMATRLRLSKSQEQRLVDWCDTAKLPSDAREAALRRQLYAGSPQGIADRLKLELAGSRARAINEDAALMQAAGYSRLLKAAQTWQRPTFPMSGADLKAAGMEEGPALGAHLKTLEQAWVESDFSLSRDALLERAAKV